MKNLEYEIALLKILEKLGGTASAKDALVLMGNELSKKLSRDSKEYAHNKIQKEIIWKNKVRWARQHLKEKGQLDGSVVGIWSLTDKGMARLKSFIEKGVDPDKKLAEEREVINPLTNKPMILHKSEITKKSEETVQIEAIIRDMVSLDRDVINNQIVDEVNNRLKISVDTKKISRIRNQIGLGAYDLFNASARRMEESTIEKIALLMALHCVRNTIIETYHGEGKINDNEMKNFNKEVVNKMYTFLRFYFGTMPKEESKEFMAMISMYLPNWDKPKLDEEMMAGLDIAMGKISYKETEAKKKLSQ